MWSVLLVPSAGKHVSSATGAKRGKIFNRSYRCQARENMWAVLLVLYRRPEKMRVRKMNAMIVWYKHSWWAGRKIYQSVSFWEGVRILGNRKKKEAGRGKNAIDNSVIPRSKVQRNDLTLRGVWLKSLRLLYRSFRLNLLGSLSNVPNMERLTWTPLWVVNWVQ